MPIKPIEALTKSQLKFLGSVDSPTVANAIELLNVRDRTEGFLDGDIRCEFPEFSPMVGVALTVEMSDQAGEPGDKKHWWHMWEALEEMPEPAVLVMKDVSGHPNRVAYAGEIMARLAMRLGAVGMVTDGALRDVAEAQALGFHYFMKHAVVSHGNFAVSSVGNDVSLGGEIVRTGDVLHGDRNGVVVIPRSTMGELESAVETIRISERADMDLIDSTEFSLDLFKKHRNYGK